MDRDLLWDCLGRLGITDPLLSVLRSMYSNVRLQVRMHGSLGTSFPSVVGVKQGDPLSPLLFGLLIDRMELFFRSKLPDVGAQLLDTLIQLLLYADDVAQCSISPAQTQDLLDCLSKFSAASKLTVSVKKSEVMVFKSHMSNHNTQHNFHYNGSPITVTSSFTYLGNVVVDGDAAYRSQTAFNAMFLKAQKTYNMSYGKWRTMEIHNVDLTLHLFDSLVRPVLNFGAEVWGPAMLKLSTITTDHACESWHRKVLKRAVGVSPSTPTHILMEELGRLPLCFLTG